LKGLRLSRVVRGVVVRRVREMRETVVSQQVSIGHPDSREQQQQQLYNEPKLGLRYPEVLHQHTLHTPREHHQIKPLLLAVRQIETRVVRMPGSLMESLLQQKRRPRQ
jgi:hypothetical protein